MRALTSALIASLAATSVAAQPFLNRFAADSVYESPGFAKWIESAKPGDIYMYETGAITLQGDPEPETNGTATANSTTSGAEIDSTSPDANATSLDTDSGSNATASQLDTRAECYYNSPTLQTNVDHTGTWWDQWFKISGCQWCNSDQCSLGFDWSQTSTWRIRGDFDQSGAQAAEDAINGNGDRNQGLQWGRAFSAGSRLLCGASRGATASIWRQNRYGWSDIAQRTVSVNRCPGRPNGYSEWKFSHIDWAITGEKGYQLGCSYNEAAHC